jgi:predicted RNase H-like nuclease
MDQDGGKPLSTRFVGVDLAWSPRNTSAAVVLEAEGERAQWIAHCERLGDNEEMLAFIREAGGSGPALIAIDAPLIVPNEEGARLVDRQITRLFGRYGAGCYPAYRNRPGGCTRGEEIVLELTYYGFVQDPHVQKRAATRTVFEVYPHPAMLALFHLAQTIKYKARPKRTLDFRRRELARLRACLVNLDGHEPALSSPPAVTDRDPNVLRGTAIKRYEDLLDAAICAYIAYYVWYWGPQGYEVYGDTTRGYILVPMTEWMRERLAKHVGKSWSTSEDDHHSTDKPRQATR